MTKEEKIQAKEQKKLEKQKKKEQKKNNLSKTEEFAKKKIGGFFSDFKKFISKGNIIDLAVAVVIGGAFGKIVTSLVNDIIMPLIGALFGKKTLTELVWTIKPATDTTAALTVNYGNFLQSIIDFLIIAFCIFIVLRLLMNAQKGIKGLTRKQKKELKKTGEVAELPPVKPIESQEDILRDIRELLKQQNGVTEEVKEEIKVTKTEEKPEEK